MRIVGVVASFAYILSFSASGLEVPLSFEAFKDNADSFMPHGYQSLNGMPEKLAGEWKLPTLVSTKPLYQIVTLGDRQYFFVVDQQKADDRFYNRLYFDANGNGDLTDERPIDTGIDEDGAFMSTKFPALDLTVTVDSKELPYRIAVDVERYSPGAIIRAIATLTGQKFEKTVIGASVECAYAGRFELAGKEYTLRLCDENANGRFDDRLTIGPDVPDSPDEFSLTGDRMYLSIGGQTESVGQYVSDFCVLGNQVFDVTMNVAEKKIVFAPHGGEAGQIRLPGPFEHVTVVTEDRKQSASFFKPEAVVPIPAGTYRLVEYSLERKDEQGDLWRLEASGRRDMAPLAATSGQETAWALCEPLNAQVVVVDKQPRKRWFGPPEVSLEFAVQGAGGERIASIDCYGKVEAPDTERGSVRRMPAPSFKVIKPDGEVVAQGKCEYG